MLTSHSMVRRTLIPAALAAALAVSASAPASAQMQRSVIESLNMWSPPHWNDTKAMALYEVHSNAYIGYATNPSGSTDDPANAAYFKYTAPAGAIIYFDPSFGLAVPPPTATSDACHHAHLTWAVYRAGVQYIRIGFSTFQFPFMSLLSSTGELGKRMANGVQVPDLRPEPCVISPAPDTFYSMYNGVFLWGPENQAASFGTTGNINISQALVAVTAGAHGWINCGNFQCYPQINMYAYRFQ
jgi:hypothetical protein